MRDMFNQENYLEENPTITVEPNQVEKRLRTLSPDLSTLLFHEVCSSALSARAEVTFASAVTEAGSNQWFLTVRYLRTRLANAGWIIANPSNCPFIVSTDKAISIIVMTGDSLTGIPDQGSPSNQAQKGKVLAGRVYDNQQLNLVKRVQHYSQDTPETVVWVLLYHYDQKTSELRLELSMPNGFNKGKITSWGERIIVPAIHDNDIIPDLLPFEDQDHSETIVDVTPKTGTI